MTDNETVKTVKTEKPKPWQFKRDNQAIQKESPKAHAINRP